ncbi:hypothetical protein SAMN05428995_10847 [Loktanella sp. DSM 29012]|nr:hypothetical protein SAMN05428995_10847 [Loktanella sp. DSM 29012]
MTTAPDIILALAALRPAEAIAPPPALLDRTALDVPLADPDAVDHWAGQVLAGQSLPGGLRIALDLDDTLLHGSQTCPALWDRGGYGDPAIVPGWRYDRMQVSWRGRLHLLRGRPRYDAVDRRHHPALTAPRIVVTPDLPMLSVLGWLQTRGAVLGLATASARTRVDLLLDRLPALRALVGPRVMAAEDLAHRLTTAPDDADPLWSAAAPAHAARPLSLAAKTPWALAPLWDGAGYDLLVDDSAVTAALMDTAGLGDRLLHIPGGALSPAAGWANAAALLRRLAGLPALDSIPAPPPVGALRIEDPLYWPCLHLSDQFEDPAHG